MPASHTTWPKPLSEWRCGNSTSCSLMLYVSGLSSNRVPLERRKRSISSRCATPPWRPGAQSSKALPSGEMVKCSSASGIRFLMSRGTSIEIESCLAGSGGALTPSSRKRPGDQEASGPAFHIDPHCLGDVHDLRTDMGIPVFMVNCTQTPP